MALSIDKRNRRSQRHELQADAERHLEQTVMGRGVPGRCAGGAACADSRRCQGAGKQADSQPKAERVMGHLSPRRRRVGLVKAWQKAGKGGRAMMDDVAERTMAGRAGLELVPRTLGDGCTVCLRVEAMPGDTMCADCKGYARDYAELWAKRFLEREARRARLVAAQPRQQMGVVPHRRSVWRRLAAWVEHRWVLLTAVAVFAAFWVGVGVMAWHAWGPR
jgi:hypothetical protein